MRRSGSLREGTSNSAHNVTYSGDLVSGTSVSRPCLGSGPRSAARHSLWRSHAKAPSGDVQSGTGATLDCERPHRITTQLSFLLGSNRTQPSGISSRALLACDAPLQELRASSAIHSRSRLATRFYSNLRSISAAVHKSPIVSRQRAQLDQSGARCHFRTS